MRYITPNVKKYQVDLVNKHRRGRKRVVESVKIEARDRSDAKRIARSQWVGGHECVYDIRQAGLKEPIKDTDEMIALLKKLTDEGMKFPKAGYMKWEDKYKIGQDWTFFEPGGWKYRGLPDGYDIIGNMKEYFVGCEDPKRVHELDAAMMNAYSLRNRKEPLKVNRWMLDSGAFSQIGLGEHAPGKFVQTPEEYVNDLPYAYRTAET